MLMSWQSRLKWHKWRYLLPKCYRDQPRVIRLCSGRAARLIFLSCQILVGNRVCHLAFVCVQDAQWRDFMNLAFSLHMYEHVRHGRTKIISSKPPVTELAGGLLGGLRLAPSPGTHSFVDTGLCRQGLARKNSSARVPATQPTSQSFASMGCCSALPPASHAQATSCRRTNGGRTVWVCSLR